MLGIAKAERAWSFRLNGLGVIAAVAFVHFAIALSVGNRSFLAYFTLPWAMEILSTLLIPFLFYVGVSFVAAIRQKEPSPLTFLAREVRSDRQRFVTAATLLLCYALVNRSYRAIKVAIQRIEPFSWDPVFAEWDRALFGTDPWIITHGLIGDAGTQFIDAVYATWFLVILLAFGFAAFSKDRPFQLRASLTYFLIWILFGNLLALLWSSAGPVYYEHFFGRDLFAPLVEKLAPLDLTAVRLQAFLLDAVGDEMIGSGISAMPSVHCAMTMYLIIVCYDRWGLSPQLAAAAVYHLLILVGSVHLGWHYAVDGLVSTAAVPLLWWASGRVLRATGDMPAADHR